MKFPKLRILDKWHGKKNVKWVYSNDPHFHGIFDFLSWVLQHQPDYNGIEVIYEPNEKKEDFECLSSWNGLLHRHPRLEYEGKIPKDHVVVDADEWAAVRELLYDQGILNGRKKRRIFIETGLFCKDQG